MGGAVENHVVVGGAVVDGAVDSGAVEDAVADDDAMAGGADVDGECFNPETCCDARERAMITMLRAYLRPEAAPECLLTRLRATLDRCCCDDDQR
ncbi:hypothetical protein [Bifidobacterium leontopitheci]|uniref:hypothetical protein n=1 Tax=Bifidobacterium leontopitheci TaxID=2650774 RepID=UPI00361EA21F